MCHACKAGAGSARGRAGAPHAAEGPVVPRPGDLVVAWGQILLSAARTSTLVAPRPAGVTVGLHLHVFILGVVTRGHGVGTEVFSPCVGPELAPRLNWEPPPKPGGAASIALAQKRSPVFAPGLEWEHSKARGELQGWRPGGLRWERAPSPGLLPPAMGGHSSSNPTCRTGEGRRMESFQ